MSDNATGRHQPDIQPTRPRNEAVWHRGVLLSAIGLACFLPAVAVAVFSESLRLYAALSTLLFWIVWKIGRTLMKINSGDS